MRTGTKVALILISGFLSTMLAPMKGALATSGGTVCAIQNVSEEAAKETAQAIDVLLNGAAQLTQAITLWQRESIEAANDAVRRASEAFNTANERFASVKKNFDLSKDIALYSDESYRAWSEIVLADAETALSRPIEVEYIEEKMGVELARMEGTVQELVKPVKYEQLIDLMGKVAVQARGRILLESTQEPKKEPKTFRYADTVKEVRENRILARELVEANAYVLRASVAFSGIIEPKL